MSARKLQTLDVRKIIEAGGEPFLQIRERVDALVGDEGLTVIAPFLPAPLIELLKSEGFFVDAERRGDGSWSVNFTRD